MLRKRFQPSATMRLGLAFMVVANATRWFLERRMHASDRLVDPLVGFFFGISFGLLVLSLIQSRRAS